MSIGMGPTEQHELEYWDAFFEKDSSGRVFFEQHLEWYGQSYRAFRRLVSGLMPEGNLSVLEVGCGSGLMSYACASSCSDITLLDISPSALAFARSLCPSELKDSMQFVQASMFDLPLHNKRFDLIHSTGVLEHYTRTEITAALREFQRVAKPRAIMVHLVPNPWSLPVLKARLLGSSLGRRWMSRVPGYRNDSERPYTAAVLREIFSGALPHHHHQIVYLGPVGFTGWSSGVVRAFNRSMERSVAAFLVGVVSTTP